MSISPQGTSLGEQNRMSTNPLLPPQGRQVALQEDAFSPLADTPEFDINKVTIGGVPLGEAYTRHTRRGSVRDSSLLEGDNLFFAAIAGDEEAIRTAIKPALDSDILDTRLRAFDTIERALEKIITDEKVEDPVKALQTLANCGIDFDIKGDLTSRYNPFRPLHKVVKTNKPEIARALVTFGANPDSVDQYGSRPFNYAITPEMASALKEGGADLEALSSDGSTPLREALNLLQLETPGSRENALALLSVGARVNWDTIRPSEGLLAHSLLQGGLNRSTVASSLVVTHPDVILRLTVAHLKQKAITYLATGVALSILPYQALRAYSCATMEEVSEAPVDDSFYGRYFASPTAQPLAQTFAECFFGE